MTTSTEHSDTNVSAPLIQTEVAVVATSGLPYRGGDDDAPPVARRRRAPRVKNLLVHAALVVICAAAILPFLWMLSTSLKTPEATLEYPPRVLPRPIEWHNYVEVFTSPKANFLLWTRNTLIV